MLMAMGVREWLGISEWLAITIAISAGMAVGWMFIFFCRKFYE
jgi:ABC-type uncharacterized transport system permease subunit